MLTYVLTALQDEKAVLGGTPQKNSAVDGSPISSFRNSDSNGSSVDDEEKESAVTSNTIQSDLLFPDFSSEDKESAKKRVLLPLTSSKSSSDMPPPPPSSQEWTWEERIEHEIEAARAAAIPPSDVPGVDPAILQDESMNSVNSYELLQQNVQMGDVISKERFLSFDSKEDIDFAETRGILIAQKLQQSQIIFEEEDDDDTSALSSPGLHISPRARNNDDTTAGALDDSFCSLEDSAMIMTEEQRRETNSIVDECDNDGIGEVDSHSKLSVTSHEDDLDLIGLVDSESTYAVRNTQKPSSIYSTRVSIAGNETARVLIMKDEKKDDSPSVEEELKDCLSASESEVASIDGLPTRLRTKWKTAPEQMMKKLDGIRGVRRRSSQASPLPPKGLSRGTRRRERPSIADLQEEDCSNLGPYFEPCFNFSFWGECTEEKSDDKRKSKLSWKDRHDVPLAILDCSNLIHQEDRVPPPVPTSLVRVASDHPSPSYSETILPTEVDPRMQDWISGQFRFRSRPPKDGSFHLGESRTVVVHEINRGNWTWCTEWSPDGALMAVATENHHLAIVDTTSSTVWRVRHDRKVRGPMKNDTTHSIRAIAWGNSFIAIGGTGNAVSILAPRDPYQILHTIKGTGFVGCLHWRKNSNVLAIGSRLDFAMIVRIRTSNEDNDSLSQSTIRIDSEVLHRIKYNYWVNSLSFSPDGSFLAVGDSGGIVSVYDYEDSGEEVETNMIAWFKRKSALLSIDWSPDGKWLYAGGEDRSVTVIDTNFWEIVHRIGRDRWVQCIASSNGGSHVAVGGVSSEISLLDVDKGWDSVMGIELKGLVPLSAKWHPKDQYLAVTGQDTSILVVETTNARHVKGHHLHSISPVLAIEFSPDGRMAIIGNEAGIVTFYSLSGTTFITAYELVVPLDTKICTEWSRNGMFVVIGAMDNLTVVGRKRNKRQGKKCPPNASGFSVKKVLRDIGETNSVSIDWQSHYVAVSGTCTVILDVRADFSIVREWADGPYFANAWSPDGRWLAMIGQGKSLAIYDTSSRQVDQWKAIFSMKCDFVGYALAWGPVMVGGLLYLAYGGDSNEIFIMEIRTHEGTWETVLRIGRDDTINSLDWSTDGLLAAGIGNGTVGVIDLAYLQSGMAVNEMDYNWQRQALTCFTEIRRNRGKNSIRSLRWLPAAPGSDRLLAIGGTDGEVEILDLTERQRCRGYVRGKKKTT